jgi:flagellar protein FlaJ
MMRITKGDKKVVWAISAVIGLALAVTVIINALFWKVSMFFETDQLLFITVIVALFPPALVDLLDDRWKRSVDKNIPEFLRELSEAGRTGITLTRAIELASERKYGPLSSELRNVVVKLSWGSDLGDTMRVFAERVATKLARRASLLITEIHRFGGDIREVLDMVSKHIGELQNIEEERRAELRNYISIIYIAFFIFLFIDVLLLKTLFYRIESLRQTLAEEGGGLFLAGGIGLIHIQNVMFHMSLIQGLLGGLVAGKMGEGSVAAGLKHSLILMSVGFIIFIILFWR